MNHTIEEMLSSSDIELIQLGICLMQETEPQDKWETILKAYTNPRIWTYIIEDVDVKFIDLSALAEWDNLNLSVLGGSGTVFTGYNSTTGIPMTTNIVYTTTEGTNSFSFKTEI